MWIMTTFGFFSIVEKPEDRGTEFLTVRARVKDDLVNLCAETGTRTSRITEVKHADYRFRARISREAISMVLSKTVLNLDYDNFKDEVKKRQGASRAGWYGRIWNVLWNMQKFYARKVDA